MKIFNIIFATMAMLALSGCATDDINTIDSERTEKDGICVSSFSIAKALWNVESTGADHYIGLVPANTDAIIKIPAEIAHHNDRVECRMTIERPMQVADGTYHLFLFDSKGQRVAPTLNVAVSDEQLTQASAMQNLYRSLKGSGTQDDPYLLSGQSDFLSMIMTVDDEQGAHGLGLWFRQNADIEVPPQSSMTTGRGYYSTSFAGNYNGANFRLTGLNYTGANNPDKDMAVGLFSKLLDGATVENVVIEGLDISGASHAGAIAGETSGDVSIRNVKATGNISLGGDCLGGLVGLGSDRLSVDTYDMNMTVNGNYGIGGVVGKIIGSLTVRNLVTPSHRFRLTAQGKCGGVAGEIIGNATIENITLDHSVQTEDGDVRIISSEDGAYCGGIVGYFSISSTSAIRNATLQAPVGGGKQVGGLAGYVWANASLAIDGCKVSSLVSGTEATGGVAGKVEATLIGEISFEGKTTGVIIDFNAAKISGVKNTGGLIGLFSGDILLFKSNVQIAVNVIGSGDNTGGLFGSICRGNLTSAPSLDLSNVEFTNSTMQIKSSGSHTGAIAGLAQDYHIKFPQSFSLSNGNNANPVDPNGMKPFFTGIVAGNDFTGGVAGSMSNCYVSGAVFGGTVTGSGHVGGIVGEMQVSSQGGCHIKSCALPSSAYVESTGSFCGGIAGRIGNSSGNSASFEMRDCVNSAPVKGGDRTGGIIGEIYVGNNDTRLQWLVNTGTVSAKGTAGGLVGRADISSSQHIRISDCANYATVKTAASSGSWAGGILGCTFSHHVHITGCANHGMIDSGDNTSAAGGVAGHMGQDPSGVSQSENVEIAYSMNSAEVKSSTWNANLGGILGYQEEGTQHGHDEYSVHNCYNTGRISSDQDSDNGGIIGKVSHYSKIHRCMNYGRVEYGNAAIGTRQSSAIVYHDYLHYQSGSGKDWYANRSIPESELGNQSQYEGFDFSSIWIISDGKAKLRSCPWQNITTYR